MKLGGLGERVLGMTDPQNQCGTTQISAKCLNTEDSMFMTKYKLQISEYRNELIHC